MASNDKNINKAGTMTIDRDMVLDCVSKPDKEKSRPGSPLRIFQCNGDEFHATSVIMCALNETSARYFLNKTDFRLSSGKGAIVECNLDKKWIVLNEYDGYEYYEFSNEEKSDRGPMHTVVSKLLPNNISDYLKDNTVTLLFGEYDLNDEYKSGVLNHIF